VSGQLNPGCQWPPIGWNHDPDRADLPSDYTAALTSLKDLVRQAQFKAQRAVNSAMIELYWNIGRTILDRQANEAWGSKILDKLARDLRSEFPHMRGFSRTNVYKMRSRPHGPGLNQLSRHRLDN
jgi:hypothetical protein